MNIAESIDCDFAIVQSPGLNQLRIAIRPLLPDSHLDKHLMSLELHPETPLTSAKELERALNDLVGALVVTRESETGE